MKTICTIRSWHGTYRLSSGARADRASSGHDDALFFLLASLRRRDPEVLSAIAQSGTGLFSHPSPAFQHDRDLSDAALESIACDLQRRVASGQILITKVDPLKDLHVRDLPPPQPESTG
jgi:hypothetical protein